MSLPSSFSSLPDQNPHKYIKNLLIDLKKEINKKAPPEVLQNKMQALINATKKLKYKDPHKKDIFHKTETTKAISKIWTEFDRYVLFIKNEPEKANPQDLLDAILLVENLLKENDIY